MLQSSAARLLRPANSAAWRTCMPLAGVVCSMTTEGGTGRKRETIEEDIKEAKADLDAQRSKQGEGSGTDWERLSHSGVGKTSPTNEAGSGQGPEAGSYKNAGTTPPSPGHPTTATTNPTKGFSKD